MRPDEVLGLKAVIDGSMAGLEGVEAKRLFGCDGYFVNGNIFGLVWKDARLGLRFGNYESLNEVLSIAGAETWRMGNRVMGRWALLPAEWSRRPKCLRQWVAVAFKEALARPHRAAVTRRNASKRVKPAIFRRLV